MSASRAARPHPPDEQKVAQVGGHFRQRFGTDPGGVWAAPGRVNLIGEHTDYNDGWVLPFAIDRRAHVAARRHDEGVLRLCSVQSGDFELRLDDLRPGGVSGWPAYLAGAIWAVSEALGVRVRGLDLMLDSDVPSGAGLSSSAAIECATALATADLHGVAPSRRELALAAHRAEVEMAGVPCGTMDQFASMCAERDHAMLLDCRSLELRQVPLSLPELGLVALVIDTKAPHRLVSGEYAERRKDCEAAALALSVRALRDATLEQVTSSPSLGEVERRRARHVVTENERVQRTVQALERGDLAAAGPLLSASHASLRDDFEVTVPELDAAAEAAVEGGALGARMIGGGFGGCVLALVREAEAEAVFETVQRAFERRGFASPQRLLARPSEGARRVA